jgi:hypothetical protein
MLALDMQFACNYAICMSNIQIRNVPDDIHRKLKARAASMGMSLSDYLLHEVEQIAKLPTQQEMLERLSKLPPPSHRLNTF